MARLRRGGAWRKPLGGGLWAGVLALLAVPYFRALSTPSFGLFQDDGIYAVTARALAHGEGYRLTHLPGAPAQTKYPPGFPLALAAAWRWATDPAGGVVALKLVPLIWAVVWLALSYRLLRAADLPGPVAAAACVAAAASPLTVYVATALLSETMFAALSTGAILALQRRDTTARAAAAGALAGAAILTRAAGIALPLAVAGWLIAGRSWKSLAAFLAAVAAFALPWMLWTARHPVTGYYGADNYASWHLFSQAAPGLEGKLNVLTGNLWICALTPSVLWSLPSVTALAAVALFGLGLAAALRRNSLPAWYAALYLGLVLVWMWPPTRFLAVALPVLLWVALQAVPRDWLARRRWWVAAALAAAALPGGVEAWRRSDSAAATGVYSWSGDARESWAGIEAAAAWIRSHTPPDTLLVANLDALFYLQTGRQAERGYTIDPYRLFYAGGDRAGAVQWRLPPLAGRPAAVVETPDASFAESRLVHEAIAAEERRGALREVFRSGRVRVLFPNAPRPIAQ